MASRVAHFETPRLARTPFSRPKAMPGVVVKGEVAREVACPAGKKGERRP